MEKRIEAKTPLRLMPFVDYLVVPFFIVMAVYSSNLIHGFIDYFEAGKELACVNEVFHAKVLYRDVYSHFGPLNIYLEAGTLFLFGKSLAVLRAYYYVGTVATLVIFYLISLKICRRRLFSYAAAFFLVVETFQPFWCTRWGGFRFGVGALALLCAVLFFKSGKNKWLFFSGLSVAVSFLITFDVGILSGMAIGGGLLLFFVYKFFNTRTMPVKSVSFFIFGIFSVIAPFLVYFLSTGALFPYINTLVITAKCQGAAWAIPDLNLRDYMHLSKILTCDFKYISSLILYVLLAIIMARRVYKNRISYVDYSLLSIILYGVFMLVIKVTSKRLLAGPQFQMALQPAIVLSFLFMDNIYENMKALKNNKLAGKTAFKFMALAIVLLLSAGYFLFSEKRFYGSLGQWAYYEENKNSFMPIYSGAVPVSKMSLAALAIDRAKGVIVPADQAGEIEGVVKYITAATAPNEPVFSFPEHGIFNFFTDRPCIDRFTIAGFAWVPMEWRRELLADLENVKPRYIIYSRRLSNLAMAADRDKELLPEVAQYVFSRYHKEASFGSIDIWRRNNS